MADTEWVARAATFYRHEMHSEWTLRSELHPFIDVLLEPGFEEEE